LNFAENLLFPKNLHVNESSTAVITATEVDGQLRTATWAQLREAVRQCSNALRAAGVKPRDVVAGYVSNHVESLVAMLAAAAIGAIWTSISPDNGISAVLDRLVQIEPKVLFADNGTVYNGKSWPGMDKTAQIVSELKSLELVVVIKNISEAQPQLHELEFMGSIVAKEYQSFLDR
jgi:acetoacetyl-CoA synthetase